MLQLMLKYHDYQLAIFMTETLTEIHIKCLNNIYQDWCIQMLMRSNKGSLALQSLFEKKFDELAQKFAIE